jgi:hypothetical protein
VHLFVLVFDAGDGKLLLAFIERSFSERGALFGGLLKVNVIDLADFVLLFKVFQFVLIVKLVFGDDSF